MNGLYGDIEVDGAGQSEFGQDERINPAYTEHTETQDTVKERASIGPDVKAPSQKDPYGKNIKIKKPISKRNKIIAGVIIIVFVAFGAALLTTPAKPLQINIPAPAPVSEPVSAPVSEPVPVDATIMGSNGGQHDDTAPSAQQSKAPSNAAAGDGAGSGIDAALLARLQDIETRNRDIEEKLALLSRGKVVTKQTARNIRHIPVKHVRAHQKSAVVVVKRIAAPNTISVEPKEPVADAVRIAGVTIKPGGAIAVISAFGVTKRYMQGDQVPGLGKIERIGINSGISFVEISGVTYH